MLVLCVKPQHVERALHEIRGHIDSTPLVWSIVAGIKISKIGESLHNNRIVRSMPNTPGQIGEGITVWTATYDVLDEHKVMAKTVLGAFFFSSRRRHTRWTGDWSSDVCSSD